MTNGKPLTRSDTASHERIAFLLAGEGGGFNLVIKNISTVRSSRHIEAYEGSSGFVSRKEEKSGRVSLFRKVQGRE